MDFGAMGGGAAEGLEQVLRRLFLESQQRQQAELAKQSMDVQARGQDISLRGQDLSQKRYDTDRSDAQAAAAKAEADKAAAGEERKATVGRLVAANPQLGRLVDARSLGFNINDPHQLESDAEHAPHRAAEQAEKVKQVGAESDARNASEAKYRAPAAPREESKIWVSRNGQLIRISEREYQPGDLPANTREQGRPVISGDANRIADLDTSLNDLKVLRDTLKGTPAATGTVAKLGAMAPNVVTEMTGFGAGAKSRQAVIDRVKQVIGKALEGGVLRKEDELKYAKILPTIADPDPVVETKLSGLEQAIAQRKQTTIDSLGDAGYDVSKYAARQGAQPNDAAKRAADLIKKYGGG